VFLSCSNARSEVIDLFFSERYLQTIQTNCPHILRYLTTAVITNPRRRNVLKDLVRIIQQEHNTYRDPITEFVECLLVNFDFDSAQSKLKQCEKLCEFSNMHTRMHELCVLRV
jgi:translation initiation factor 3 subunit E